MWPRVQLFHGEGVVSAILVGSLIGKEKILDLDFFYFWAPGTEEERKRQRSKRRKSAEEVKNGEEEKIGKHRRGKDKFWPDPFERRKRYYCGPLQNKPIRFLGMKQ
ncbi:hypothetical protein CMV_019159 [Castanea mollissima]|uniref:Uncharacterized protein n=1 Tax=Castanea mollissima TaxID=60419 RepID=A0A8J4R0X6_9ROSI|nr:hypothetical protein CMV_019159 [Castanea mollissima]